MSPYSEWNINKLKKNQMISSIESRKKCLTKSNIHSWWKIPSQTRNRRPLKQREASVKPHCWPRLPEKGWPSPRDCTQDKQCMLSAMLHVPLEARLGATGEGRTHGHLDYKAELKHTDLDHPQRKFNEIHKTAIETNTSLHQKWTGVRNRKITFKAASKVQNT